MAIHLNNQAADAHRLDLQRFTGEIPKTPDHFIVARVKGEKDTIIEFSPSRLDIVQAKYPNGLIYIKNAPK